MRMSVHQIYPPIRFCIATYVTIIMILHLLSHVDMYPIQMMTSRKPDYGLELMPIYLIQPASVFQFTRIF